MYRTRFSIRLSWLVLAEILIDAGNEIFLRISDGISTYNCVGLHFITLYFVFSLILVSKFSFYVSYHDEIGDMETVWRNL